jgi:hypothetical protein
LRKISGTTKLLTHCVFALFLDNFLIIVLAFLTEFLPPEISSPITAVLFVSIGFIWALIGWALLKQVDQNTMTKLES